MKHLSATKLVVLAKQTTNSVVNIAYVGSPREDCREILMMFEPSSLPSQRLLRLS